MPLDLHLCLSLFFSASPQPILTPPSLSTLFFLSVGDSGWSVVTHLHLPLVEPLLSGPLANVIGVPGLEGNPGHWPLPEADLPAHTPPQTPARALLEGTQQ